MRPGQLDALAEAASEVVLPAGHRIFDEGDNADHFWLIQSGYVVLDVISDHTPSPRLPHSPARTASGTAPMPAAASRRRR